MTSILNTKPVPSDSHEAIEDYLVKAFETREASTIMEAMGNVARARNVSVLAQKTQLRREALYRSLSREGNPHLSTLMKVLDAWGLQLSVERKLTMTGPSAGSAESA